MAEDTPATVEEFLTGPTTLEPDQFKFVKFKVDGATARMTMNRPEYNFLNERMLQELAAGVEYLRDKDEVKLIVLDSALKVFCGGIEVGEYTTQRVFQMLDAFQHVFTAILDVGKPLLIVVNGPAIGGGCELVAFGDMVIATPKASFAQPEISIGFFPPLASTMLPYLIGPKLALEMVLTGEKMDAQRAKDVRLVNRIVAENELEATVNGIAAKIAGQSGAVLAMAKKAVLEGMGMSLKDGLKNSMNIFLNELYKLEDSQEGLRALMEKRKPQWKNR
jgi:cyclohexa-1,5-dienecarbonyl-CoA hydratase